MEEFTPESRLLSTCMSTIRVYDRLGNRENLARNRMRYLVNEMGWEKFQSLLLKERVIVEATTSIPTKNIFDNVLNIGNNDIAISPISSKKTLPLINSGNEQTPYNRWLNTNVVAQKQSGYYGVYYNIRCW